MPDQDARLAEIETRLAAAEARIRTLENHIHDSPHSGPHLRDPASTTTGRTDLGYRPRVREPERPPPSSWPSGGIGFTGDPRRDAVL